MLDIDFNVLFSGLIYKLLVDDNGDFWVGMYLGLVKYCLLIDDFECFIKDNIVMKFDLVMVLV